MGDDGDTFKKGIVDAAKITRSALQNAASSAATVLTTETLIADLPEKKRWAACQSLDVLPPTVKASPGDPRAAAGWQAIYVDSPETLKPKMMLADERGLAGAGFWAIGYERGQPGYTDLIKTFAAGKLKEGNGGRDG